MSEEFLKQISKFCQDRLEPIVQEDDKHARFRLDIYQGLGNLGLAGLGIEEQFGGIPCSLQFQAECLSEVAKYSVSYAATLSVSLMCQSLLQQFGNNSQKEQYLPSLSSGKSIAAFALTEPESGSDAMSLQLRATQEGEFFVLQGQKHFITSGEVASVFLVFARTEEKEISCFLVDSQTKGLVIGKSEEKMGWRSSPTNPLFFQNCKIPKSCLVGTRGQGGKIAFSALDKGRITIASIANGLSTKALSKAYQYASLRKQFGQEIFHFQAIQFLLADMAIELEASKALVQTACHHFEQKTPQKTLMASAAKCKATDMAMKITTDAVQVLGGVGYTCDYSVERFMRDAKVLQILEGTNQIQRLVVARNLEAFFQS